MIAHGALKLFGISGNGGISATAKYFSGIGLEPGVPMVVVAGCTEFFGGIFLILGLLTRFSGAAIVGTMAVAIVTGHSSTYFVSTNGVEYPLTLLLASLGLVIGGGGALSLDRKLSVQ